MQEFLAKTESETPHVRPGIAGLWRALPRRLRYSLLSRLSWAAAPARAAPADVRPGPVTVAGLLSTATGLGESARLHHAALRRLGIPTNTFDLSARIGRADLPAPASSERGPEPGEGGTLMLHLNALHLPMALVLIGRGCLRHKRIVGYWA